MALISKLLKESYQVSFNLWFHYLSFLIKEIAARRWPFSIHEDEFVGRALFSGNYDSKKGIALKAFILKDASKGISVNRLSYAPKKHIDLLSKIEAQGRTNTARKKNASAGEIRFYGYASITAANINRIDIDGKFLGTKATLTLGNPFHSDIVLPADEGKDFYLDMADRLRQKSTFVSAANE